MRYMLLVEQEGAAQYGIEPDACERSLKAQTLEDAIAESMKMIEEDYSNEEMQLSGAKLFEVTREVTFDLTSFYAAIEQKREEEDNTSRTQRELEEFKKLQQKYGNY